MRRAAQHVGRTWRRFSLGSGPLKRGTDRVQALSRVLLLVIVLAAIPVALCTASTSRGHLIGAAAAQARSRHQVQAVLLQDAVSSTASYESAPYYAPVRWTTAAGGGARVDTLPVPPGARAGTSVPVWVDAAGNLTAAPLGERDIRREARLIGIGSGIGLVLAGWVLHALVCQGLARRRDRQWTAGWSAVEPLWTAQLP
jgi:hypothetical protein